MHRRDALKLALSSLALPVLGSHQAAAQDYPKQQIRLIVPRSAGGVVDVVARLWADRVKPQLPNVIIENQGGGGGTIAANAAARAKPDGYTLFAATTAELIITPLITASVGYDPVKDFAPIAITAVSISTIMVHSSLPVTNLKELAAYAKANPGKLSYGSAGVGTTAHLCFELFKQLAGVPDIVHVPYKGANPGLADFFSGHLPIFAAAISPQVLEMQAQGKIRILVASGPRKLAGAPQVPISAEVGFPDLIAMVFIGVFAPSATPRPIIDQIAAATRTVTADTGFQQKLINAGFEPMPDFGPEQTAKFVAEEHVRWAPLLKTSGLTLK